MTTPKIILSPRVEISKFPNGLEQFLEIMEHPEALLTDASQVYDFGDVEDSKLDYLSRLAGFRVTLGTPVWKICRGIERP